MARTKRAQVLMEPEEYRLLEEVARTEKVPVAELFRRAVRDRYLTGQADREKLVRDICAMNLPDVDWAEAKADIMESHDAGLP